MERQILDLGDLGLPEIPVFGRYNYRTTHPALRKHYHPHCIEICYLDRGTQTYRADGKKYRLRGGDIFVTPPRMEHDTGGEPENPGRLYWLNVSLPLEGEAMLLLPAIESKALWERLIGIGAQKCCGREELKQLFEDVFLIHETDSTPLGRIRAANHLVRLLLIVIECATVSTQSRVSADILNIARLIRHDPVEYPSISELAKLCKLSSSRFKAKFKEQVGIPPHEYILDTKIEMAKTLLTARTSSVTDIAMQLGFNSSQYFSTVFKKHTGQNPSNYDPRKQVRFCHKENQPRDAVRYSSDEYTLPSVETVYMQ